MMHRAIQAYMRDAVRPLDVNVFKVEIFYDGSLEPSIHYFVNRLELGYTDGGKSPGNESTYEKLKAAEKLLNLNTAQSA